MNIIAFIGATCLGIVTGWLVRYFILRFKTFTSQTPCSVISIIAGGAVIKIICSRVMSSYFIRHLRLDIGHSVVPT